MTIWIIVYILSALIATVILMVCSDTHDDQDRELCFALGMIWPLVLAIIVGVWIAVHVVKLLGMIADKISGGTNEG